MQQSRSQTVATFCVNKRNLLFIISSILSLLLATGILCTSFDSSLSALLTKSDPYLDELELLQDEFPSNLEIVFAFAADPDASVFDKSILQAMDDLKQSYSAIPFVTRFSSILDYLAPDTQRRLFGKPWNEYSDDELASMADSAVEDRLLTTNLLSKDGTLTFALVSTDGDIDDAEQRIAIAIGALGVRDELRDRYPELTIHVNSEVLLEQSSQQAMIDDLTTLMPFIILICVLVICFCFRSAKLGICILAHTLFTIVCTVGALGFLGYSFNTISIIAPLVVVIVSIANSVHIISIYKQSLQRNESSNQAMQVSMAYNFQPITLAALTTAIGFSSLNMCSSPAIKEFGQIVAIGIGFAYILTLTILPALLMVLAKSLRKSDSERTPFLHSSLSRLSLFTKRNDKLIFWSCTGFAVITLAMLPLNETDFNRLDFIATDSDIKQYYDDVSDRMNRGPALIYGVDSEANDAVLEPLFLSQMDGFDGWLNDQPDIESVISLVDVVKTINQFLYPSDADSFRVPDSKEEVENYLNAYKLAESTDFPKANFVNADNSIMPFFVNAIPMSNQELIDLDIRITAEFETRFPQFTVIHGSGILLFARMDELVTIELLQGYSISLLLITLTLIIGLRSVYFGILSVLPNLLPATMVFGVWALFVGQLDPFVMMLFSISIGLVVDDTVHILSHYLDARREGADKTDSINHSILTAGPALTITTMVLALGTTILIGANTLYFQQAAKLLVPIVVLALVLDLMYLPTILKRFDNRFKVADTVSS